MIKASVSVVILLFAAVSVVLIGRALADEPVDVVPMRWLPPHPLPCRPGIALPPVISAFVYYPNHRDDDFGPRRIIAIWDTGLVIKSDGDGYKVGLVDPQRVRDLAASLRGQNPSDYSLGIVMDGIGSTSLDVYVEGSGWFSASSDHEVYERANPGKMMAHDHKMLDIEPGKTLYDMLAVQPEDYREFRDRWQTLRDAIDELASEAEIYVGDLEFIMARNLKEDRE